MSREDANVGGAGLTVFRRRLLAWGRRNRREFPWREENDPFRILVAELLLQRSRGTTVAKVYPRLFARFPDAAAFAAARVEEIADVIRPLGLTARAATLKALAARVVELRGVPRTIEGLMELPGVGRYVATATAVVAFGARAGVVDGVTARVYRRYFGLDGAAPPVSDERLWATVHDATPSRHVREWNWAVLDLASAICLPKIPRCAICPLQASCATGASRTRVPQRPAAKITSM